MMNNGSIENASIEIEGELFGKPHCPNYIPEDLPVVFGLYRTGKSYLMNRLANERKDSGYMYEINKDDLFGVINSGYMYEINKDDLFGVISECLSSSLRMNNEDDNDSDIIVACIGTHEAVGVLPNKGCLQQESEHFGKRSCFQKNGKMDELIAQRLNEPFGKASKEHQHQVQETKQLQDSDSKMSQIYDGRLILLGSNQVNDLEASLDKKSIGKGGIGKVYRCYNPDIFGISVAVKKINTKGDSKIESQVRSEKIACRLTNPFILPLLDVVEKSNESNEKRELWFVPPLCENADLYEVLKHDRTKSTMKLNTQKRVKILLQVALAIQYIHTAVPGDRAVILHKDIASKNIVLDDMFNARLIDFGLAKEEDDISTIPGDVRLLNLHPTVGEEGANESWDYYSFGVILRDPNYDLYELIMQQEIKECIEWELFFTSWTEQHIGFFGKYLTWLDLMRGLTGKRINEDNVKQVTWRNYYRAIIITKKETMIDSGKHSSMASVEPGSGSIHDTEEFHELEEMLKCKVCLDADLCILFLPCRHMAVCERCGSVLEHCPVCRATIENSIEINFE